MTDHTITDYPKYLRTLAESLLMGEMEWAKKYEHCVTIARELIMCARQLEKLTED